MLQYEASEVTGDQMPDQVNVTFSTETKSLTKLNLRRSRHFNLDIPLYSLDTDQEGIFHRHKVKTRPKKDLGFYQDITNKAAFRIQRSSEKSAYKKSKLNLVSFPQLIFSGRNQNGLNFMDSGFSGWDDAPVAMQFPA
ncbi:ADAM family mig-17, partial [Biomphalaria glabrata]